MSDFNLSLDDISSDPLGAIIREQRKNLVDGRSYATSNSVDGVKAPFGVFSMSEIMQGVPSLGTGQDILGFQEQAMSQNLNAILQHHGEDDQGDVGVLQSPIDFLVPDDIRQKAVLTGSLLKEVGGDDDTKQAADDSGLNDGLISGLDPSGTQIHGGSAGSGGYRVPGGAHLILVSGIPTSLAGGVVQTNAAALMRMPNYQYGFPHHPWGDDIAAGHVKPELIKCLMYLCQVVVPYPEGLFYPWRTDRKDGGGISNHGYHAAIDIDRWAWPENPTNILHVSNPASDDLIRFIYSILNSLTGLDRPDEIGGPPRLPYNDNNMPGPDGPFYQDSNHAAHLHIGFEYATVLGNQGLPPRDDGLNGVRTNTQNDNSWSVLPTVPVWNSNASTKVNVK